MTTKSCFAVAALVVALALSGCKPGEEISPTALAATNARVFMVTGVVERVVIPERHAIIKHEKIPGYMAAMTMRFDVKDTNELSAVKAGDAVTFRYVVRENEDWIEQVTKLAVVVKTNASAPKIVPRFVEELRVGAMLPDLRFTNQNGIARRLSDFQGRQLALSFIYTRCTLPHLCSHVGEQFAQLSRHTNTNTLLLCVTLDPAHDTPEVMRVYMRQRGWNTNATEFLTSDSETLRTFAAQCGVARLENGGVIQHNLRLVLADSTGRVTRLLRGNNWTDETVAREFALLTPNARQP